MEDQNFNQQPVERPIPQPQVPIQPEQPIISPQQPKTNWLILILVLALAVVSYAGVAYWQGMWPFSPGEEAMVEESPTPTSAADVTASWKAYRNDKFDFEVKYPKEWFIYATEKVVSPGIFRLLFARDQNKITPAQEGGSLPLDVNGTLVLTHGWRNDFDIWIRSTQHSVLMDNRDVIKGIAVYKAEETQVSAMGDMPTTTIIFNHGGYGWGISFPNFVGGGHDKIYDQVLSTFKLTQ